jgi:hypothetical protein
MDKMLSEKIKECAELRADNTAMREWLERIYISQGWSDLGEFLKEIDFGRINTKGETS